MKPNFQTQILNINNSGLGCLLTFMIVGLLLSAIGLKWIVNGVLILIALSIIIPIVGFWAFRWWLKRNLVEDNCPVCNYSFTGFNNVDCRCPNCDELLTAKFGKFIRETPPGTIDVDAVEVTKTAIDSE